MFLEAQNIILVNSEESLLTVLSYNIERCGFIVHTHNNLDTAVTASEQIAPSVIIIDDNSENAPTKGKFNYTVEEAILAFKEKFNTKNTPIILLTSNKDKYINNAKVESLISSYIQKPFVPSMLVSKIRSLKNTRVEVSQNRFLEFRDIRMNVGSYKVTRNGKNIHLGPTEFKILQCLMELPTKVLTREHIMRHVWGHNSHVDPRTIDVHINRLRSALKNDNERDFLLIRTVRSVGYCLSKF
jgi:two-component system phosphate regulon response regulator PhoB